METADQVGDSGQSKNEVPIELFVKKCLLAFIDATILFLEQSCSDSLVWTEDTCTADKCLKLYRGKKLLAQQP